MKFPPAHKYNPTSFSLSSEIDTSSRPPAGLILSRTSKGLHPKSPSSSDVEGVFHIVFCEKILQILVKGKASAP